MNNRTKLSLLLLLIFSAISVIHAGSLTKDAFLATYRDFNIKHLTTGNVVFAYTASTGQIVTESFGTEIMTEELRTYLGINEKAFDVYRDSRLKELKDKINPGLLDTVAIYLKKVQANGDDAYFPQGRVEIGMIGKINSDFTDKPSFKNCKIHLILDSNKMLLKLEWIRPADNKGENPAEEFQTVLVKGIPTVNHTDDQYIKMDNVFIVEGVFSYHEHDIKYRVVQLIPLDIDAYIEWLNFTDKI